MNKIKKISFVTSSEKKKSEFNEILKKSGLEYEFVKTGKSIQLDEPHYEKDIKKFVKKKTLTAFQKIKLPVIVEHTTLEIPYFNNLPGKLTNYFTGKLKNSDICKLMKEEKLYRFATAKTYIGFCDGKKVHIFKGEMEGEISTYPKGENGFGWDNIFIPLENNERKKTYAEMNMKEKNKSSMRTLAIDKMKKFLLKSEVTFFDKSDKNKKELHKKISERKKIVLFIGAGVSRNLGFPSWGGLIEEIGEKLGYDPEVFSSLSNDYLALADYSGKENFSIIKEALIERFNIKKFDIEKRKNIEKKIETSNIYTYINQLNPSMIFTTNYDQIIEKSFEIHGKKVEVVGLNDKKRMATSQLKVVKIHGDIDDLENGIRDIQELNSRLVLTEEGYFGAYDDISDSMSKAGKGKKAYELLKRELEGDNIIIFLGYSLSDSNIRYFFHKNTNKGCRENIFIFTTSSDPVQEKILEGRGIKTIVGDNPNQGEALEDFLYELKRTLPNYEAKANKGEKNGNK